ncbi:hypothetical protein K432DRAFT_385090 [Lepidopterella palustris CBS 459.81]|uniref:Uncharacterized protein n=1 Tax=Lepidopterella palustris CBS 459.81 TaxID=1314670 RepID=A0A8E2JBY8_9PEZI|nr:hypothetical protein K432DRAFT_385090 [Lepidopterella palustris CBS 459.81]
MLKQPLATNLDKHMATLTAGIPWHLPSGFDIISRRATNEYYIDSVVAQMRFEQRAFHGSMP